MASVTFDAATRVYPGSEHPSVDAVTFNIADGEFLSLLGPNGAGKSTALRMLAGLEEVTAGRILLDGHDIDTIPPHDRDVAMAFQNYALYPHMSVADNMGFALRVAGIPAKEIDRRVRHAAEILNLTDQLNALPDQLNGHGARQLVALGRAVVREPRVFMMDDPLANLDADLRLDTGHHIAELQQRLGITTLFATSSPTEAEAFGNRIAVLNHGRLEQIGPPEDIINTPASIFVALYAAPEPMNLCLAPINGNHATLGTFTVPIPDHIRHHLTDTIVLGARPCHTTISPDNTGCPTHIDTITPTPPHGAANPHTTTATMREHLDTTIPALNRIDHDLADTDTCLPMPPLRALIPTEHNLAQGDLVHLTPDPNHIHFFNPHTGQRLGP